MLDSACFATRRCGVSRRRSKCESLTRVTRRPLRYVTRMLPYSHLEVTRKSLAIAAGSSERPGRGAPSFSYTASVHCATVDIESYRRVYAARRCKFIWICRRRCLNIVRCIGWIHGASRSSRLVYYGTTARHHCYS